MTLAFLLGITMTMKIDFDHVAKTIAQMSREDVQDELLCFEGRFELDFPKDYLEKLSAERLRHILLAARIQQYRIH